MIALSGICMTKVNGQQQSMQHRQKKSLQIALEFTREDISSKSTWHTNSIVRALLHVRLLE